MYVQKQTSSSMSLRRPSAPTPRDALFPQLTQNACMGAREPRCRGRAGRKQETADRPVGFQLPAGASTSTASARRTIHSLLPSLTAKLQCFLGSVATASRFAMPCALYMAGGSYAYLHACVTACMYAQRHAISSMVTAASASETALRARPSCKALRAQPSAPHSSSGRGSISSKSGLNSTPDRSRTQT